MGRHRDGLHIINEYERLYQRYYSRCPHIYDAIEYKYHNWEEFRSVFEQEVGEPQSIQKDPPTEMNEELPEGGWFAENDDVSIVVNARFCPPFWHHLKFIKLTYVLNGECFFYTAGGEKLILSAGSFVIVPPDVEQTVFSCHEEDIVINIIIRKSTFENTFSSLLTESRILAQFFCKVLYGKDESSIFYFNGCNDAKLDELILDMYDVIAESAPNRNFFLVSGVMYFLAYALAHYQEKLKPIREERLKANELPIIIRYIKKHYDTVTLSELAETFHKSEGYLCRYIKRETGHSLTQLLKDFRMKKAALLLRDSDCSIESIMLQVGYTDISYFYKTFREYYGTTPTGFRQQGKRINL